MSKKERPAPLSDAIFRAKLEQHQAPNGAGAPVVPEEIPVRNTFIQFGSREGVEFGKQHLSTAPAWVGPSIQSMIQSVMQQPVAQAAPQPAPQPELFLHADGAHAAQKQEWASLSSPKKLASPKKVPVMRYSLSGSSARAVGLPTSNAVVASYEPCGVWPEFVGGAGGGACGEAPAASWPSGGGRQPSTTQAGDDEDDDEEDDDADSEGTPVPVGELPSAGSAKHHEGLCKRCCFFPKGRCLNDRNCEFCHYDHEKRKRKKKKKKGAKKDDSDSEDGGSHASATDGAADAAHRGDAAATDLLRLHGDAVAVTPNEDEYNAAYDTVAVALAGSSSSEEMWASTPSASCASAVAAGAEPLPLPPHVMGQQGLPPVAPPPLPPRGLPPLSGPPLAPPGGGGALQGAQVDRYYASAAAAPPFGGVDGYSAPPAAQSCGTVAPGGLGAPERFSTYSPYVGYGPGALQQQALCGGRPPPR